MYRVEITSYNITFNYLLIAVFIFRKPRKSVGDECCCFPCRTTLSQTQELPPSPPSLIASNGALSQKKKSRPSSWPWKDKCISPRAIWTEFIWWATPQPQQTLASRYPSYDPVTQECIGVRFSTASRTTTTLSTCRSKVCK